MPSQLRGPLLSRSPAPALGSAQSGGRRGHRRRTAEAEGCKGERPIGASQRMPRAGRHLPSEGERGALGPAHGGLLQVSGGVAAAPPGCLEGCGSAPCKIGRRHGAVFQQRGRSVPRALTTMGGGAGERRPARGGGRPACRPLWGRGHQCRRGQRRRRLARANGRMPGRRPRRGRPVHALAQLGGLAPLQVVLLLQRRRGQAALLAAHGRRRRRRWRSALVRARPSVKPADCCGHCGRGFERFHNGRVARRACVDASRLCWRPRAARAGKGRRGLSGRMQLAASHARRWGGRRVPASGSRLARAGRRPGRRLAWARRKQILRRKHGLAPWLCSTGPRRGREPCRVLRGGLPQSLRMKPRTAPRRRRVHGKIARAPRLRHPLLHGARPEVPAGLGLSREGCAGLFGPGARTREVLRKARRRRHRD